MDYWIEWTLTCLSLSCSILASRFLSGGERYFCVSNFFSSSMVWSLEKRTCPPFLLCRGRWMKGVHSRGFPLEENRLRSINTQKQCKEEKQKNLVTFWEKKEANETCTVATKCKPGQLMTQQQTMAHVSYFGSSMVLCFLICYCIFRVIHSYFLFNLLLCF